MVLEGIFAIGANVLTFQSLESLAILKLAIPNFIAKVGVPPWWTLPRSMPIYHRNIEECHIG